MNAFKRSGIPVLIIMFVMSLAQFMLGPTLAATIRQSAPEARIGDSIKPLSITIPFVSYLPLAQTTEYLYGVSQVCSFGLTNPQNSIDGAFNNAVASASGQWGRNAANWTFDIQDSTLVPGNVTAEIRFYTGGYVNDPFVIEAYNGTSWSILATFNSLSLPPTVLNTLSYNVTGIYNTTAKLNSAQLRFRGTGVSGSADTFIIYIDEVRINDSGSPLPGSLVQSHYRIGNDANLSAMTWKGSVDRQPINLLRNSNFRIRLQVRNNGGQTINWQPGLEWSTSSNSGYSPIPATTGAVPFFITGTSFYANGTTIPVSYFGCGTGTGTAQNGIAYTSENPASTNMSLGNGIYTEVEFNVQANDNAANNGTYFFRLTNNGVAFSSYAAVASVRIQQQASSMDPHNSYTLTTDKCAACHRAHTGANDKLRKNTTEEALCLACHNGIGTPTNIQAEFNMTYRHPIQATEGVHGTNETASANFSGINRHVECEDCHTPHSLLPGIHQTGNNAASPVIFSASGLAVTNGAANTTPSYTFVDSVSYEYELCFKCHSAWANVTSRRYPSYNSTFYLTDQSREFNPANRATHAVEAVGKNRSTNPNYLQTFVSPISPDSTIYCSDCHGSSNTTNSFGPHGSNNKSLLAGSVYDQTIVCYKCHRYDVYGGNSPPNASLSRVNHPINSAMADPADNVWGIYCLNCHGGAMQGGLHGTNAGIGPAGGTANLGDHFMNGASMTGFTPGTGGVNNSGACWTKASADSVNLCTKAHSNTGFTPNYDY